MDAVEEAVGRVPALSDHGESSVHFALEVDLLLELPEIVEESAL